jgi:hypothetical protein
MASFMLGRLMPISAVMALVLGCLVTMSLSRLALAVPMGLPMPALGTADERLFLVRRPVMRALRGGAGNRVMRMPRSVMPTHIDPPVLRLGRHGREGRQPFRCRWSIGRGRRRHGRRGLPFLDWRLIWRRLLSEYRRSETRQCNGCENRENTVHNPPLAASFPAPARTIAAAVRAGTGYGREFSRAAARFVDDG